jgi:hypothetical protein
MGGGLSGIVSAQRPEPKQVVLPARATPAQATVQTLIDGDRLEAGRVVAVVADRDGAVYVADERAAQISVFDSGGRRLRTIGRAGQGPGEFGRNLRDLAWLGDTLVAVDVERRLVTKFSRDGRYLDAFRLGEASWLLKYHSGGGRMYATGRLRLGPAVRSGSEQVRRPVRRYFRMTADSAEMLPGIVDSVPEPLGSDCEQTNGDIAILRPPFPDRGALAAATPSGGLAVASRERYTIRVFDPLSAALALRIDRPLPAVVVTDRMWEAASARHRSLVGLIRCNPPYERPSHLPVLRMMTVDERGRFWLEVTTPTGYVLDVVDPVAGTVIETPMPARDPSVTPFVRNDRMYFVALDTDDVQSIRTLTLRR